MSNRLLDGFMAQVGINGDPKVQEKWRDNTIKDDKVVASTAEDMTRGGAGLWLGITYLAVANTAFTFFLIQFAGRGIRVKSAEVLSGAAQRSASNMATKKITMGTPVAAPRHRRPRLGRCHCPVATSAMPKAQAPIRKRKKVRITGSRSWVIAAPTGKEVLIRKA